MTRRPRRIVVVGAGIAGITCARTLAAAGAEVVVLEAEGEPGGRARTTDHPLAPIDHGATTVHPRSHRHLFEHLRAAGALHELTPIAATAPLAIWRSGRLRPVARRAPSLLTGDLVTGAARLQLAAAVARIARARTDVDHPERSPLARLTVAELGAGPGPTLGVLEALAAGILCVDPHRLSAAVLAAEVRATGLATGRHRYVARHGFATLVALLAADLDVRTGVRAQGVQADGSVVSVDTDHGTLEADGAVLAVPAPVATLLAPAAPPVRRAHTAASSFSSLVTVTAAVAPRRRHLLPDDVHGVAFPPHEGTGLAWVAFAEAKHRHRIPGGPTLVQAALDGVTSTALVDADDEEVAAVLAPRLEARWPGVVDGATVVHVDRHRWAMPEFTPASLAHRHALAAAPPTTIELAGDWLSAPSTEGATRSGERAAHRVLGAAAAGFPPTRETCHPP